jgi:hypothetical protein
MAHVILDEAELLPQPGEPAPVRPHRERQRSQTLVYGTPVDIDPEKDYDRLMAELEEKLNMLPAVQFIDRNGKKK